ncbi:protein trunk [Anopheles arabiensis]|uniref:Trunk n=3 Tax=gambiae species complex TaxID=44542 RepID=A0A6E8VCA3_ANOCL|nr:protein trunk [Anopheles arabiensis]XP_040228980.1 protein trunk [Anopheles coluzzii]
MLRRALVAAMLLLLTLILLQCDGRALKRGSNDNDDGYSFLSKQSENACGQLPPPVLTEILGPAFNPRYMSIEEPPVADSGDHANPAGKRDAEPFPPFYVDDTYSLELSNKPAWEVSHVSESIPHGDGDARVRTRRDLFNDILETMAEPAADTTAAEPDDGSNPAAARPVRSFGGKGRTRSPSTGGSPRPWECEAKIRWIDLGPEYFPRFLRTVECTRQKCWYGHYSCQPRSFTVKILRRRTGECVQSDRLRRIGVDGLPGELRELWVWEERAVNFCCDCAPAF